LAQGRPSIAVVFSLLTFTMEVAGVKLETTHAAAIATVVGVLLIVLFMKAGGSSKKKQQQPKKQKAQAPVSDKSKAKKTAPVSDKSKKEDKPVSNKKKGAAPSPAKKGKEVIVAPVKAKDVKDKKGKAAAPVKAEEGWTTVAAPKRVAKKIVVEKAQAEANAAIPGAGAVAKETKAKVSQSVHRDYKKEALESAARVDALLAEQAEMAATRGNEDSTAFTATVKVPDAKIGAVVGPKGVTIEKIKEKTGATRIDTTGGFCVITAEDQESCDAAKKAVEDIVNKGYSSIQFEDFGELTVSAFPSQFHELIGQKGAIVKQLKEQLEVEITFPATPAKGAGKGGNQQAEKKLKIQVGGPKEGVEQAKAAMNEIIEFHHSDITHPGFVHKYTHVEPHYFHVIIGKGGGEMKHIQSNYKVKVYIPRGDGETEDIMVVGPEAGVDRAIAYIVRSVENYANKPQGGRGGDGDWGGEDEYDDTVDDDLQGYIFKRR